MKLEGIIENDTTVLGDDGVKYHLFVMQRDSDGLPEVLIDARAVGGDGSFYRQSIKPYIGMRVEFSLDKVGGGYDYKILKE
jgi:hypothetical protein